MKKRNIKLIYALLLILSILLITNPIKAFQVKKGDILITNRTGSWEKGLTGHSGIAVSGNRILHISGKKNRTTQIISLKKWIKDYGKKKGIFQPTRTTVYRINMKKKAQNAAEWAYKNYYNKKGDNKKGQKQTIKPKYAIKWGNYWKRNPTYCSKIVWQAYAQNKVMTPYIGIVQPYHLIQMIKPYYRDKYVKIVKKF